MASPYSFPEKPTSTVRGYRPFLLLVLFLSLYWAYLILRPFFHTLVFGILLATMFHSLQLKLCRLLRGRKNLAAMVMIVFITFVLVLPILFFLSELVSQGVVSINQMNDWLREGNLQKLAQDRRILTFSNWIEEHVTFIDYDRQRFTNDLLLLSRNLGQLLLSKGAVLLSNVASLVTDFFIMIFIVYFLLRDGAEMLDQARTFSPLRKHQEDQILNGIRLVAKSVLLGTFLTALCQGLVGGIGLAIIGIPGLFWGTVMGFSSLIPIVGTALVWVPAVVYLLLLGKVKSALFFAVWSILLTGSIDNFLRPFLMGGEGRLSPFYVFLAIIGGVQYFGLVGILYGPLILSFTMIMLYIYGAEYRSDLLSEKAEAEHP